MNQHTYSFPKVTPADPHELREQMRASRRQAATNGGTPQQARTDDPAPRASREN